MILRRADLDALLDRMNELQRRTDELAQRLNDLLHRQAVRLSERDFLVRTWYGWSVVPAEDEALLAWMLEHASKRVPGTATLMAALIGDGETVIDVGAHIGTLAIPAARHVGETGRVIAVEPIPRLAEILKRSAHINGLGDRMRVETCAAGGHASTGRIHVGQSLALTSLLPIRDEVTSVEVTVRPLDDLVPPRTTVSLVKIDAEGYELEVWRGMQRIVAENPEVALIVEFGPSHLKRAGIGVDAWLATFLERGHRAYEIDEESGGCSPLRTSGLADVFSLNLLLLKRPQQSYPRLLFTP
ncbi:MAG: FkbM family methyltransferase [Candidatus Eremiobacteraeota bacterium]|nr:FkbM family methyltransferase [Candidatus Eremiobacteraeota bacterium]